MKNTNGKKKKIGLIVAVLILVGAGLAVYFFHFNKDNNLTTNTSTGSGDGVNLAPPTSQEKEESSSAKDTIVDQQKDQTIPTTGKKQVSVAITSASKSGVYANITGIFEDGGTCTATFTQGSTSIVRTSQGFANVSYTQCTPISPDLPAGGAWTVIVGYSSDKAEGTSQSQAL